MIFLYILLMNLAIIYYLIDDENEMKKGYYGLLIYGTKKDTMVMVL